LVSINEISRRFGEVVNLLGGQKLKNRELKFVFAAAVIFLLPVLTVYGGPLARITVEAGEHIRVDTPVSVALEGITATQLRLEEIKDSERVPVPSQIEFSDPMRLWWILSGTTEAGGTRVYELSEGPAVEAKGVEVIKNDSFLQLQIGDKKVLRYNHAVVPPPEGADPHYARSGFIHPLWSPAGEILTCIHPEDHIHHMGLWGPWTKTEFEGKEVDFWNLDEGQGTVRFVDFFSDESGVVFGGFSALQEHVVLNTAEGEKVALNEELDVRVWNLGEPEGWLIDYTTKQCCASESPLKLLAYRYGGLGFRATLEWDESNSDYLTSEGKSREDGHGTRARWCDVFGTTSKGPAGIIFMSYPGNHEHPEPMRIWPEGKVFFNFCPIQKEDWIFEPGEDYVLRYRMYVHSGKSTAETAERLWQDFSYPPEVKLEVLK